MAKDQKSAAAERAAAQREKYVKALEEEREGYKRQKLDDRVKDVDAELKRVKGAPKGASSDDSGKQTRASDGGEGEGANAEPDKQPKSSGRGRGKSGQKD